MVLPTYILRRVPATLSILPRNPSIIATARPATQSRPFTYSTTRNKTKENYMDKDSINAEPSEYAKSGSDSGAASEQSAFDPDVTEPGQEKNHAEKGSKEQGNPLDASPANHDISKPRSTTEGGAENSASGDKNGKGSNGGSQSGFGSPKKSS